MTTKVEKEKPSNTNVKRERSRLLIFSFRVFFPFHFSDQPFVLFSGLTFSLSSMVLPFPLYFSSLWSLSSMILPFPLYCSSLSSLPSLVLPFPLYSSSLSSLSSMLLPFPLYSSSLSSMIFSPCRPGFAPGT